MDVKQFRIGNYVQQKITQAPLKIKSIDPDSLFWFGLEPILLTEEWIKKLGFNCKYQSDHNKGTAIGVWGKSFVSISIAENGFYYHNSAGWASITYKYVHQLQNLYFCLTGEELTIK